MSNENDIVALREILTVNRNIAQSLNEWLDENAPKREKNDAMVILIRETKERSRETESKIRQYFKDNNVPEEEEN